MLVTSTFNGNLTAGDSVTLICEVDGVDDISPDIKYTWWHYDGGDTKSINSNVSELSFSPLKLSDAGEYICGVNISSTLLSSNLISNSSMPSLIVNVLGKSM